MTTVVGCPLQVVKVKEGKDGNTLELDENALGSILLRPAIQAKKVVLLSVAGALREGKSFLLDFFLRFMTSEGKDGWMGTSKAQLTGFNWRGGAERDTCGIHMWSEPFLTKLSGEDVAVLFMDTQGSFDMKSTFGQCAKIFALSAMLSSIQVYNIHGRLREDYLQNLELFIEYGKMALKPGSTEAPFQHLQFLIRDWCSPDDYAYGSEGGKKLLDSSLKETDEMGSEQTSVRKNIKSCFSRLQCYLLPHPGLKVANDRNFKGQIADMEDEFIKQLKGFVQEMMSDEVMRVKKVNGQSLTCKELMQYFKSYMEVFKNGTMPELKSILGATSEAYNLVAVSKCKEKYTLEMDKICGSSCPHVSNKVIDDYHQKWRSECLDMFKKIEKIGGDSYSEPFYDDLSSEIDRILREYKRNNDVKYTVQKGVCSKKIIAAAESFSLKITCVRGSLYIIERQVKDKKVSKLFDISAYTVATLTVPFTLGLSGGIAKDVIRSVKDIVEMSPGTLTVSAEEYEKQIEEVKKQMATLYHSGEQVRRFIDEFNNLFEAEAKAAIVNKKALIFDSIGQLTNVINKWKEEPPRSDQIDAARSTLSEMDEFCENLIEDFS